MPRHVDDREQQIPEFFVDLRRLATSDGILELIQFLLDLFSHTPPVTPVEADIGGAFAQFLRAFQGRQCLGNSCEHAVVAICRPFLRLDTLPAAVLCSRSALEVIAEHMRMAAPHLVIDACRDIGEIEVPEFLGHAGVKHDLEQQVAEFIAKRGHVVAGNGISDLIGFFERIRGYRREVLLEVPRATCLRVTKRGHYFK